MKKTLTLLAIALGLFFANSVMAQKQGKIVFKETKHDFGLIKEDGGVTIHKFEFTNEGDFPIVITNVKSSCGCTTPDWTKQPVPPGGKGFVSAAYDPRNRPSKFTKTVTVTSKLAEGKQKTTVLTITGDVQARQKTLEEIYRYNMDGLRFKTNHAAFAKLYTTETKTKELEVINKSDKDIKLSFNLLPKHLKVRMIPETLKPNEKGIVEVTYDAKIKNDFGYVTDYLRPQINSITNNKNRLIVSASLQEDFSKLTKKEIENGPTMDFKETVHNFGKLNQGDKTEYEFEFTNNGKSDLIIRKVTASCGCTAIKPAKNQIAPGETSKIKAIFSSAGKKGRQNKSITIITNIPDANNYRKILRMKGEVLVEAPYFDVISRSAKSGDAKDAARIYYVTCTATHKKATVIFRKDGKFELLNSGIMWNDTFDTMKAAQEAALKQLSCEKPKS